MTISELIGKIVTLLLKEELTGEKGASTEGTARFTIDCLSAEHTAAVARQILSEPTLAAQIDLKLPLEFLKGQNLPAQVLTSLPATYFRNAAAEKPVLLIANTGDDEEQSLKEFIRIGGPELQEHPELWIRVASEGLSLSDTHARWWEKAISGLQELRVAPLDRIASYVLQTRAAVQAEGLPVLTALGVALPALRLPKDSVFSSRIKEGVRGHVSAWKREFTAAFRSRACYLLKQTPSQLLLGQEELESAFAKAKDSIPLGLHPVVTAFIEAPSGWNPRAAALAECEWEQVRPLFDGVKREKFNLARETIQFFDDREPELLSVEERQYLLSLVRRINEAVFGAPERLDRDLWLSRLSDLILDGVQFPASSRINLSDWRRAIREGECEIAVRGYSHVFVWGPDEPCDCSSFASVADLDGSYQEVFGRPELRELVLCYQQDRDPMELRRRIAQQDVWAEIEYQRPTDRMKIKAPRLHKSDDGDAPPTDTGGSGNTPIVPPNPTAPVPATTPKGGHSQNTVADTAIASWAFDGIGEAIASSQPSHESVDDEEWLRSVESKAKHALQQFQLQAKVASIALTPNCALIKFAGSSSLTVEQVNRKRSELLTTFGLNVVAVRPEPGLISLSIERPKRRLILTQELWSRWQPGAGWGNRSLLIGVREDDGNLLILSPGKLHAPHTLIAGSTGSGKSVLMQNIILAIAATNTPAQARIVLIDPKQGVDYFSFESIPHLEGSLLVESEAAIERLQQLVTEMDARYARFRTARCPNLDTYNERAAIADRLPVIWVIHDEFAEWMMVEEYKEAVTSIVARLGVKARAAGIHLVFAAQRPDANVMPMQLRANLGNRLILKVDSIGTSEIALGESGAEYLLGNGHLLAKLDGAPGLCYAQVPYADPSFVDRIVALLGTK